MPLKLIAPVAHRSPYWRIRGTYLGVYVDRSTKARKRTLAAQALHQLEREIERGEFSERPAATFVTAAADYMKAGGDRRFMAPLLRHFADTPLSRIDQAAIDAAANELYPKAAPATRNRQVYTPISAVMRRAGVRLDLKRPIGAGGTKVTAWLWPEQAFSIFAQARKLNTEFEALLIVLTYTGLRLNEALRLTWNDVRLTEAFAYVSQTKNDDPRPVFLPPVAMAALGNLPADRTRIFRFSKSGHLYSLLKVAAIKAGVDLPERAAFHIFRHTYATWMRREAGLDTRGLIATGAWRDRKSADRYEHVVVTEEARKAALLPTPKLGVVVKSIG
jgi:integrase